VVARIHMILHTLTEQNGLIIGTAAQPSIPGIDQQWAATIAGITGNHRTTTAVTVIDGSTLKVVRLGDDFVWI